jgi:hypothetical protein
MESSPGSLRRRRARRVATVSTLAGASVLLLAASPAPLPHSSGISGFSGKQTTICSLCHSGGTLPTVTIGGPVYVLHDSQRSYSLTVSGGQAIAAGLDVAVDDNAGSLVVTDSGTHLDNGEITHNAPRSVDGNGDARFDFDFLAPSTAMTLTMYGAGNSVNLDSAPTGDRPRAKTLSITVVDNLTSFVQFGTGLAGSGGLVPRLLGTDGPSVGPWSMDIKNGLGGAFGLLWVGVGTTDLSPFLGGHFYIDLSQFWFYAPFVLGGQAGVAGDGTLTLNGIDVSAYAPLTLYLQATIVDPGGPKGVSMTKALELDVRN